jgi:hypothetical protein
VLLEPPPFDLVLESDDFSEDDVDVLDALDDDDEDVDDFSASIAFLRDSDG